MLTTTRLNSANLRLDSSSEEGREIYKNSCLMMHDHMINHLVSLDISWEILYITRKSGQISKLYYRILSYNMKNDRMVKEIIMMKRCQLLFQFLIILRVLVIMTFQFTKKLQRRQDRCTTNTFVDEHIWELGQMEL